MRFCLLLPLLAAALEHELVADDECTQGSCALNALQMQQRQLVESCQNNTQCDSNRTCVFKQDKSWSQCVPLDDETFQKECRYWDRGLRLSAINATKMTCNTIKCAFDQDCELGNVCVSKPDGSWAQCVPLKKEDFQKQCVGWEDDFRLASIKATHWNCPNTRCYSQDWCVSGARCAQQEDAEWGQCIMCHTKSFQTNCFSWRSSFIAAAEKACHRECLFDEAFEDDESEVDGERSGVCLKMFSPACSAAIFLGSNDLLCIADQPVKSFSLRRAGISRGAAPNEIGFRLTFAQSGRVGDPRLLTSAATKFDYIRTPSFQRLSPSFGPPRLPVRVQGRNFPIGVPKVSVRCFWSLTRDVTVGTLISGSELTCPSPSELPIIQLTGRTGSVDHLSSVSFDGGRNFHPVAAAGLAFTILHRGTAPLAERLAPTYARVGRGDTISIFGGDFMPIQRLAPSFGYCTFSWNVTYPTDLSNDTGVRASTAVYVSGREVRCQVPLDLPPATHAVQLFFTQGRYTLEARYGANVTSLDLIAPA
ncbi:unnamed protein product [Effrenium voratum]|uniref:IPT/TIG domain-containing protein n=1 Tax=Effrenium voratum TaxID=2562239 RepID=A0AA36IF36_9DINO|nr:unnamed protein product [Effrenium voratum]